MSAALGELVLPIVIRIERAEPPTRTDALEAAARGVLLMLSTDDPRWHPAVAQWDSQRIRKVVRRARGAQWRRATAVDGIDVVSGTARLRVYPPIALDAWPADLARLQVGGTELDDPQVPPPPPQNEPVVLLSPNLAMTAGKSMAQAGHAAQLGWRASRQADRDAWQDGGFALSVRQADRHQWVAAIRGGAPVVQDGGFTEVAPGSQTALALLPWLQRRE